MPRSVLACSLLLVVLPALLAAQQPGSPVLIESVEQRPVLIDSACLTPIHPDILRQAGIEGRVVLQFVVDTTGAVDPESIRVLTSTHQLFERPARTAIATCRYRPGLQAGRLVRVRKTEPVNFVLPDRERP